MAKRGPKVRTVAGGTPGRRAARELEPCSDLGPEARAEFARLVEALELIGALDRVDPGVITEVARVKALLDKAHHVADVSDAATIKVVNVLTSQRRGLLRELGLTLQPSRSVVRTNVKSASDGEDDPVRRFIKITG